MALGDPAPETLLGRLALHYKLITREQLVEATTLQAVDGGKLGDVLVARGWLTPQQLAKLNEVQKQVVAQQGQQSGRPGAAVPAAVPSSLAEQGPAAIAPIAAAPVAATPVVATPPPLAAPSPTIPTPPAVASAPSPAAVIPGAEAVVSSSSVVVPGLSSSARLEAQSGRPVPSSGRSERIFAFLEAAVGMGADDVHIHCGSVLRFRVAGELRAVGREVLTRAQTEKLAYPLMSPDEREVLERHGQVDLAVTLTGVGRFRINIYRQQRGLDIVLRVISEKPPTLARLGLPESLAKFTHYNQGLVLITGPAGCGKSSTLAALVDLINSERADHVITVEDPIEYVHPSKQCVVNQRQVGRHTESFARALRAALREDPDVIAIGELRDLETTSLALTAAETGHLVLATLHTPSTIRTINRMLGVFPPEQQPQVRMMLSESLRAVVSQRLLVRADGKGRVAATEILVNNKAVGNLIREEKTFQIYSVLQTGSIHGMNLLDASLLQLVKSGTVTKEEARRHADDQKAFV